MPCASLHGIHCIQSRFISPRCMESTAFNKNPLCHTAWNPLHSIRIHWAMMHEIHCIQSGSIVLCCMESTAFNQDPLGQAACNQLHSPRMHFTLLHGIQCIQSHCMESTASIGINYTKLHGIHFIQSRYIAPLCIESTAFNHTAWNPLHSIGIHWATLH